MAHTLGIDHQPGVLAGHHALRTRASSNRCEAFLSARDVAPAVAALGVQFARLRSQLVARHGHQQVLELLRLVQLILAGAGPHKETGQDRLTNVRRVEQPAQGGVMQPAPHFQADNALELPDQLRGRLFVAGPNAPDEFCEQVLVRH